jgi:hypothetical protein
MFDGHPCVLILDVFPRHHTERLMEAEIDDCLELLFVRLGATATFPPLEPGIVGKVKLRSRAPLQKG